MPGIVLVTERLTVYQGWDDWQCTRDRMTGSVLGTGQLAVYQGQDDWQCIRDRMPGSDTNCMQSFVL